MQPLQWIKRLSITQPQIKTKTIWLHPTLALIQASAMDLRSSSCWWSANFSQFSEDLTPHNAAEFLESLLQNGELSGSTINEQRSHLKFFFKKWCMLEEEAIEYLNIYVKQSYTIDKNIPESTTLVTACYLRLMESKRYEQALFLYLTYFLRLFPRHLWFLGAGPINDKKHSNILESDYKQALSYYCAWWSQENSRKYESLMRITIDKSKIERRVSNDVKTIIRGFLFSKKPTHWNNLFKSGFSGVIENFDLTPTQVISLREKAVDMEHNLRMAAILPLSTA